MDVGSHPRHCPAVMGAVRVRVLVALVFVFVIVLVHAKNQPLEPRLQILDADTVVVEAWSETRHRRSAEKKNSSSEKPGRLPLPHPPCFTSSGHLGRCTSFRECYPYFKIPNIPTWGTWMFGNQDTCSYFSDQVRQPDVFQTFGVCCTSPVIEISTATPPSIAEARPAPVLGSWPPPIPTHPPDHTPATHPPGFGIITHPAATPPEYSTTTTTTSNPFSTTWGTKPPGAHWPEYKPTMSTTTAQTVMSDPEYHGNCGAKNGIQDQERIVGGTNADKNEWPWMGALLNGGRQFCGCSLINSNYVLTAAHCIAAMTSYDVARVTVRLGAHSIRLKDHIVVDRAVKKIFRHRGFDMRTLYNDIATVKMAQPVQFNKFIRPICLASHISHPTKSAIVIGWGSLREAGPQPDTLQKVHIPLWENSECRAKYGAAAPGGIVEHMICAGQKDRDSCSGDSGGPLMISQNKKWYQVGVVSWGIGCGKGQYPGVYSRVSSFLPWITKNSSE